MKKTIFIILLMNIKSYSFAQDCSFLPVYISTYEFQYQPDSLNPKSKVIFEPYYLLFNKQESYFASSARINLDTLLYNNMSSVTDMNKLMRMPKATSNKRIFNSIQSKKVSLIDEINGKLYFLVDSFQLKWNLINEKDSIGGLKVKKAQTRFRGRDYIAWYCNDIPFPFGPYKFSGLPGLIIKLYDSKNYIQYSLVSLKKSEPKLFKINYEASSKKISKKEFQKLNDSFWKNPIPYMESDGNVFNEETKMIIKNRFAELRKNSNNKIELTDE